MSHLLTHEQVARGTTPGAESATATGRPADSLGVHLAVAGGAVVQVRITPSVRTGVTGTLVGRPLPEALRLVGLLFSICGKAQTIAAVRALEAAGARPAPPPMRAARAALVLCEAVEQVAVTLLLDVPAAARQAPDIRPLRTLLGLMTEARRRLARPGWDAVGGASESPGSWPDPELAETVATARACVRTVVPDMDHLPVDETALMAAFRGTDSCFAGAVRVALAEPPLVVPPPRPLSGWSLEEIAAPLRHPAADDHAVRPTWRGAAAETGSLTRFRDHPVVRALWQRGRIVAARLAAHALDLEHTLRLLDDLARGTGPERDDGPTQGHADGPHAGVGTVETARGLLVHRLVVTDGRIADWRIVAPTEWTFHPDGHLPRALAALPASNRTDLERRGRLMVAAMDPCVACDLRIEDAAHA